MWSKRIKVLCEEKKALIWFKASSWCIFLSCWRFKDLGLSSHPHFHPLGWTRTWNLEWQVTTMPTGLEIGFLWRKWLSQQTNSIRVSVIIWANFCWVKIPNYQLHDSYTRSPIADTMPFPKIHFPTIIPNIVNSQHIPSSMKMNDVIIK